MTEELLELYDKEPKVPDNFFEWDNEDKLKFQKEYLVWLTKRISMGNFKNFTHRDELNKLKTTIENNISKLKTKCVKRYANQKV